MLVDDALDLAGDRAAINVAVEHAHENGDARERLLAERELLRRHRVGDSAYPSVGGSDDDAVANGRDVRGITEEIGAPGRCRGGEPAARRPEPEQDEAYRCERG